jgi:hypothetical protein
MLDHLPRGLREGAPVACQLLAGAEGYDRDEEEGEGALLQYGGVHARCPAIAAYHVVETDDMLLLGRPEQQEYHQRYLLLSGSPIAPFLGEESNQ